MNKYLLLRKQNDMGCDYTIACGRDYNFINTELDLDEFIEREIMKEMSNGEFEDMKELIRYIDKVDRNHEFSLEEMIVIDLSDGSRHDILLDEWYDKVNEVLKNKNRTEIEQKEVAELKRLKKKYPDIE